MNWYFSKDELEECSDETYEKLKIHLPMTKKDVHLNMGQDDWGVRFLSYGNSEEMTELTNMILTWKEVYDNCNKFVEKRPSKSSPSENKAKVVVQEILDKTKGGGSNY